ncbi:hypothetical protein [Sulfurimonas indica]|uniref:hypothetical protein n=1 Tax=Sulfurimonas TaxID=202746 RepID=UPI001264E18F|nr:hypothetical protein [Sulfurimonas indica]
MRYIAIAITSVFVGIFLTGCGGSSPKPDKLLRTKTQQEQLLKETIHYTANAVKTFKKQELAIPAGAKVFIINAYPDQKKKAKEMFDFAIALMNKKGLCYKKEHDENAIEKCTKVKVEITEKGKTANLLLDSLNKGWSANEAARAIYQFNKKYFPGYLVTRPEGTLGAIKNLEIYNEQIDRDIYKYCEIDGYLERYASAQNLQIVDNPNDAEYILIYERLGCSDRYITHQPPVLMQQVLNEENTSMQTANNNQFNIYKSDGSGGVTGAVLGAGIGRAASQGFRLLLTPTVSVFGAIGAFMPRYASNKGVAYEYILIDKQKKEYFYHIVDMAGYSSMNDSAEDILNNRSSAVAKYLLQP